MVPVKMGSNSPLFLLVVIIITISHQIGQLRALRFECIDNLEDFQSNNWIAQGNTLQFAQTHNDLPAPLQGQPGLSAASGILYFQGAGADSRRKGSESKNLEKWPVPPGGLQYLYKSRLTVEGNNGSIFMYLKYYAYLEKPSQSQSSIVYPTLLQDDMDLPQTANFTWKEVTVELSPVDVADGDEVGLTAINFEETDYFLVDRIVVAEGEAGSGIEFLPGLCFDDAVQPSTTAEPETSTTTTTLGPVQTTVSPPGSFSCEGPGFLAHAGDCSQFHVCLYDTFGQWGDLLFTCPSPQVWCQATEQCESVHVCPCTQ